MPNTPQQPQTQAQPHATDGAGVDKSKSEKTAFEQMNVDDLCLQAGGHFRATAMMQKRLREIVRYGDEFSRADNKSLIFRVMDEIGDGALDFKLAQDVEAEEADTAS